MDGDEIERLVRRAQAGDVSAFEALVSSHLGQVRRFARAFARNEDEAADLAQEALLKVYRAIRSYRFKSSFSTWLYAIVRNVFLDAARGRAAKERALEQPLDRRHLDGGPNGDPSALRPDERFLREEERRRIWTALARVPVEFRTTVVLFDVEGLSYDEVAAVERVPLGTVKSRLSRGREHLRRALSAAPEVEPEAGNRAADIFVTPTKRTEPA
jgi:RNA polymerase sigma-70 factor (ECF subfamily)